MNCTKERWKAYCLGSEGYLIRPVINTPLIELKKEPNFHDKISPIARLEGSFEKQKANAYLIAAAPQLYETLKAIQSEVVEAKTGELSLRNRLKINQALAKAEGKS